jgi:arylsulfatase A-like enzyme
MMKHLPYLLLIAACTQSHADKPNIIYIMCDDLGYGDIQCLNREHGKIPTPGADHLAEAGMIFTDAHSGSSVCTPTRYGLMTGRYSWRTVLQKGVVQGYAPCLIAKDRPTVASFLKAQGYHTGIIGKWHLNLQYLNPASGEPYRQKDHKSPPVDARIPDGPVNRGFDYFHGFHHARNMEAVIENDRVIAHDPVINMLPRLKKHALAYIEARAKEKQPFFLYIPLGSPHTPIVPSKDWQGRTSLGPYGDFVMETDSVVVAITQALADHGLSEKTLVIFTSDNGCSKAAKIGDLAAKGHKVSAHLRGSKADIWDGGHRVPFIVRWPGKIAAGSTSDQVICHTDLFATLADITGAALPPGSAEDSVSYLPAFTGKPIVSTRKGIIHHSISGHFAYRQGKWKLALAKASGGWSSPREGKAPPGAARAQLYDMSEDVGETTNLYRSQPERAQALLKQLESDVTRGRSTEGPRSDNDIDTIILWKSASAGKGKKSRGKKLKTK